jgi:hypothetical protein
MIIEVIPLGIRTLWIVSPLPKRVKALERSGRPHSMVKSEPTMTTCWGCVLYMQCCFEVTNVGRHVNTVNQSTVILIANRVVTILAQSKAWKL